MRLQQAMICAVPVLFLACQTVPEGFTPEAWERYQRDNPNGAQVVRWIHESSERRALKQKCLGASQAATGRAEFAEIWFTDQAGIAMMQGLDLRKHLVDRLTRSIESTQGQIDRQIEQNAKFGLQLRPDEITERSLRRDKAMLAAISQ